MGSTLRERFDERWVTWPPTGCWIWLGAADGRGYGRIRVGSLTDATRRAALAHRVAYELYVGPIPNGLHIDHVKARGCVGPCCVNPEHLEPVTQRVNTLRGETIPAANAAKTHCPAGHPYDEANTYRHPDGGRTCRACHRRWDAEYRAAQKEAR